jgi:peroxiredoxin
MTAAPDVGDTAPDFTLPSTQGSITLSDRLQKGAVLLVFYPGDDTPVCTKQLCDYRDHLEDFSGLGVDVLAINPQGLDSHRKFAEKHGLPFPLVSDAHKNVCRAYGTMSLLGYAKRALVLVGRDGRVRWRKSDLPIFHRSAEELRGIIQGLELS